jgi:hypothetical protein
MTTLTDTFSTRTETAARPDRFLRRVLAVDAGTCAAMGLLLLAGNALLEPLLGLPAAFLAAAGLSLVPCAAFIAFVTTRENMPRAAVWAIITLNALWVVGSILLLMSGAFGPTALGTTFVLAQAGVVAILAELEYVGLRKC